jgi:anti-sigma factor RsiW
MKNHNIERLSALADGELQGLSRWVAERHLRHCQSCAKEYQQVQRVRELLADGRPTVEMSDSAEFFWSKVQREIQSHASRTTTVPVPRLTVGDWLRLHQTAWTSAVTALVVVAGVLVTLNPLDRSHRIGIITVQNAETGIADVAVTPLKSSEPDVAVIWVSGLDWATDMEEMKNMLQNSQLLGHT